MTPAEKLQQASQLIRAKRYQQARTILATIPDHPKAQEWMARIDDILFQQDPFADVPFSDEEIAAYAVGESLDDPTSEFYDDQEKPKRKPIYENSFQVVAPKRDYALLAIFTLVLYWVFWLPGFIFNLYFLQEARRVKRETGAQPNGLGCLWWVLIFNVALPLACCLLIIVVAVAVPFDEIIATPTKLLR